MPVMYQSDFYRIYSCCRAAQPEQRHHIKESSVIKHRKLLPGDRDGFLAVAGGNAYDKCIC